MFFGFRVYTAILVALKKIVGLGRHYISLGPCAASVHFKKKNEPAYSCSSGQTAV